jgi:hypothetical protein
MKHFFVTCVLGALFAAAPVSAQTFRDSVPSIDAVRSRLNLTPEQEAKLRPLFLQRGSDIQATRTKLEQAGTRTEKQAVLRTAKHDAQAFNSQVEAVLNSQQKHEWRDLRDEAREKVKERYEREKDSRERDAN